MGFIKGFEYDIFISYAHIDNVAFPGQADGWIEQFYKNLNLMLARLAGRMDDVKIWWDTKKLDGNVVFDHSIESGINKSAIMICLNSPGYIASDYCKQELDAFYQKAKNEKYGVQVGDRSRIVNVLLNNIPYSKWPKELGGTTGFQFHDAKEKDDFGDTIDTLSSEFRKQMQDLRDAVWNLLNQFPQEEKVEDPEPVDEFKIYFGEVPDTLRTPRKRVITELEKKGFKVLLGVPPPDESVAHEQATKDALKTADLSIHLLDEYPGREIIGAPDIWYPQKQVEIALNSGKAQMIWVPTETDFTVIEDEKYKTFLTGLENGGASNKQLEFIRGSKSTLAQEITDYATQIMAQQRVKKADYGKLSVLLDTHLNDQYYAFDLGKKLLEHQIQPYINSQEDDPRKNINLMGERLSQVKKLIFLYGSVSKEWVLERMSAALQLIITNNYPIEDFYVFMAPPFKEANSIALSQRFLKVNIIDISRQSVADNAVMDKFLNDLKASAL